MKPLKIISYCLLILLMGLTEATAQNRIRGLVQDSAGTPVPYCTLALLRAADSSLVKGTISNDSGAFVFEHVVPGSYRLRAGNMGFRPLLSPVVLSDSLADVAVPVMVLQPAGLNLGEVNVAAFRPTVEFREGMVILNVENNILANGNTVLELLKRIPGVIVDNQNNITVNGKGGVRFMMDGRLQQLPAAQVITLLSSMPAESVASIELIKNPPAKYDASGTAGLINIVMKRAKLKGFNGNLSQVVSQGKQFRSTTALSLNYKANKLSLFSNLSCLDIDLEDRYWMNRDLEIQGAVSRLRQNGRLLTDKSVLNANAGIEYELSSKTSLGLNASLSPNKSSFVSTAQTDIQGASGFGYSRLNYATKTNETLNSPSVNFNAMHRFDSAGTRLQYSADYTNFLNDQSTLSENRFYDGSDAEALPMNSYRSTIRRNFRIFTQKLDFTKPFQKNTTLEAGLKASFANNGSDVQLALTDPLSGQLEPAPGFSYNYTYRERILAGYASVSKSLKKLSFQAGLRAEQTDVNAVNHASGYTLRRAYLNFFPNLSIGFTPSEKHSFQSTYSYRIDRPDYNQLNPMRVFNEQLNYTVGNPQLKPQYSHNANLDYSYNQFITASLSYSRVNGFMYYYAYTDMVTKVNIDTVINFKTRNIYSLSLFVQKQLSSWYSVNLSAMLAYGDFKGTIEQTRANSQSCRAMAMLTNEFYLPKDVKAQVFASYNSPFRDAIQRYGASWSCSVVIQKSFFKRKFNAGIGVYDLFYSEVSALYNNLPGQYYSFRVKNDSRRIRLSLSYKFGNMRIVQKLNRSNEEEQGRLKNQSNQK